MYIRALDFYSFKVSTQKLLFLTKRNCSPPTNKAYPKANHEEHSDQSKLRDLVQSKWLELFKNICVMKDRTG